MLGGMGVRVIMGVRGILGVRGIMGVLCPLEDLGVPTTLLPSEVPTEGGVNYKEQNILNMK